MRKILILIGFLMLIQNTNAQEDTIYYCHVQQGINGLVCVVRNGDYDKNNVSNEIAHNYSVAIGDLETIRNDNPTFDQAGFNKVVLAQKRMAQILESMLRFLKIIHEL